jgi:hypothetical protein
MKELRFKSLKRHSLALQEFGSDKKERSSMEPYYVSPSGKQAITNIYTMS